MNGLTESEEQTVKCFGYQMKSPTESGLKKKKKKQQQQQKKTKQKKRTKFKLTIMSPNLTLDLAY